MCRVRLLWVMKDDGALLYFRQFADSSSLPVDKESLVRRWSTLSRDAAGVSHDAELAQHIVAVSNDAAHVTAYAALGCHGDVEPIEQLGVACAREVLCDVLQFFTPAVLDASAKNMHMRLAEVASFIAFALPFGEPATTTRLASVRSMVKQGFVDDVVVVNNASSTSSTASTSAAAAAASAVKDSSEGLALALPSSAAARLPAWKPFLYRIGKKRLEFVVAELVDSSQRGEEERCVARGAGVLYCRAELDGVPEVTLHLRAARASSDRATLPPTHTLATHICVSSAHLAPADDASASTADATTCKLVFAPPLGQFALAQYVFAASAKEPPFQAVYQMKESAPGTVRLLLQVRLAEHAARGTIDFCDVDLPFFNRGDIVDISGSPTSGSVGLLPSLRCLVWNVGSRFTGRQREAALSLTVYFASSGRAVSQALRRSFVGAESGATHANAGVVRALADRARHIDVDDAFCTGLTAYGRLSYKLTNCNQSSLAVDLAQTAIYPQQAASTDMRLELGSRNCFVWNTHGDWRHT